MKKEELEKIAREIVECRSLHLQTKDRGKSLIESITEALTRVQDEALKARLPSFDAMNEAWFKRDYRDGSARAWVECYDWLRANMKPQIPRAEIEKLQKVFTEAGACVPLYTGLREEYLKSLEIVNSWLQPTFPKSQVAEVGDC